MIFKNLSKWFRSMQILALIFVFILPFVLIGCGGRGGATNPMPKPKPTPGPVVEKERGPYILHCSLDLQPRLSFLKSELDFDLVTDINEGRPDRLIVYTFSAPWYYPPQANIQDIHGNQGGMWQFCPGRSPYQYTETGMERYGDQICALGYDRDWNRDADKYRTCLNRGE